MRKVPGNVPNQDALREHLQKPLTSVPDPFGTHDSFGDHNNAMLRRFLDTFGFEYEFYSATEFYRSGQFDEVLKRAAERYDAIMKVMLKSLRERAAADLFDLPADPPRDGTRSLCPDEGGERDRSHDHLRRRGRSRMDAAGDRRQRETAMEARFRCALGGAGRRFRDVRQGSLDQHADL